MRNTIGCLILRSLVRGLTLALALVLGTLWADGLLQVSRRAAEVVLSPADLQALHAAAAAPTSPAEGTESRLDAAAAGSTEPPTPPEAQTVPEPAPIPPEPPGPAEAGPAPPPEPHVSPPPGDSTDRPANDSPTVAAADPPPADDDAPVPDEAPAPAAQASAAEPEFGGAGTLQSFAGQAATAGDSTAESAAPGRGPAWIIHFRRAYTAEELSRTPQTRLVAVRQRPGYAECLPIEGRTMGACQSVAEFLQQHPQFSSRHGILLPRGWFRPLDERLLPLGGGWQFWLLVDNGLFSTWIDRLTPELAARRCVWDQVERIEGQLELPASGSAPQWRLTIQRIEVRPPGAPATVAPPPGAGTTTGQGLSRALAVRIWNSFRVSDSSGIPQFKSQILISLAEGSP